MKHTQEAGQVGVVPTWIPPGGYKYRELVPANKKLGGVAGRGTRRVDTVPSRPGLHRQWEPVSGLPQPGDHQGSETSRSKAHTRVPLLSSFL